MWLAVVAALSPCPAAADIAAARSHLLAGDHAAAAAEYKRLAEQGDGEAQASLAEMYFTGRGIDQDQEAAIEWFRRAADGGHVASQVHLGMISGQALDWFAKAAAQGDPAHQLQLGALYLDGASGQSDVESGLQWIGRAANQGYSDAQIRLGAILAEGGPERVSRRSARPSGRGWRPSAAFAGRRRSRSWCR